MKLLLVGEAQLVGFLSGLANSTMVWNAGTSDNAHSFIANSANEANVSTATPNGCAVLRCGVHYDEASICSVFASATHSDPVRRLNSATRDFSYLRNVSI